MPWEMQTLVGAKVYRIAGNKHTDGGEWKSVYPEPQVGVTFSPIRYEDKDDAEAMLERLFPDLIREQKRLLYIK